MLEYNTKKVSDSMFIRPDGEIDEAVTSEDIVKLIYSNMFDKIPDELIQQLSIKDLERILESKEKIEGIKEILRFLLKAIIEEKKEEIIKRNHKLLNKIDDIYCQVTIEKALQQKITDIINDLPGVTCAKLLKKIIIQFTNDEEYREIIKNYKSNTPIEMYEYIISQLPKQIQQELISKALENVSQKGESYDSLLKILYGGIGITLGQCFSTRLQDKDLYNRIYSIVGIEQNLDYEIIKKLLIVQGLGIISEIKMAEDEIYSSFPPGQMGGLEININYCIINYNAELKNEPEPKEEPIWCMGATSKKPQRRH